MNTENKVGKHSFLFAVSGAIIFWSSLSLSIYLHPGFDMFSPEQSLSDLGELGTTYPYVFNLGIIVTGILYMIAILGLLNRPLEKLEKTSLSVFYIALGSYIGIGLSPKGTALHIPFTITFYTLASVAIFLWCAKMFREKKYAFSLIFFTLVISAYVVFAFYKHVGYPFAELYGGTIIMTWILTVTKTAKIK